MGFLDKFLYQEEKKETKEVSTPIEPLVTNTTKIPANTVVNNVFKSEKLYGASQPSLPPEEMKKWQNYFNALLVSARESNPIYDQFLTNIEIANDADPSQTMSTKIRLAYGMMKKNASKEQIINSVNSAIDGIAADRTVVFEEKQKKKIKEGITDKTALINQKQDMIKKMNDDIKTLNNEISQLELDIENNNENINIRLECYDTLSSQLLEKVKDDLTGINNYIN